MARVANKSKPKGNASSPSAFRGPELLLELVDHMAAVLETDAAMPADAAREIAMTVAERLAAAWGGQFLWFPKARPSTSTVSWFRIDRRDLQIYLTYNGRNLAEVARQFGLTPRSVLLVVARVRLERRAQLTRLGPTTPALRPAVSAPATAALFAPAKASV